MALWGLFVLSLLQREAQDSAGVVSVQEGAPAPLVRDALERSLAKIGLRKGWNLLKMSTQPV